MPEFIAPNVLETLSSIARDLEQAATGLSQDLNALQNPATPNQSAVTPQDLVERVLALDEQISRARLLLPLCTSGVSVNEGGRSLSLADLIVETRSEFDSLARAQLEALIEGSPD